MILFFKLSRIYCRNSKINKKILFFVIFFVSQEAKTSCSYNNKQKKHLWVVLYTIEWENLDIYNINQKYLVSTVVLPY